MSAPVVIMGVDPGNTTGVCVIDVWPDENRWRLRGRSQAGPAGENDGLGQIFALVRNVLITQGVSALTMEQMFAYTTSAQEKAEAQGVVRLAAHHCNVPTFSYAPTSVRYTVVGHGRATEGDVKKVLRDVTGLNRQRPAFTVHQIDALAVALCHCLREGLLKTIEPMQEGAE